MRFLLLLPWCFLLSLATDTCNWKMPQDLDPPLKECTQTIKWKHRNEKQAKATCLEYFPTTFVEAKTGQDDSEIVCTVSAQFQCSFLNKNSKPMNMFDKCYTFHDTKEVTMEDYIKNRNTYCNDGGESGGIPVFLTMTQAQHIATEAHRQNIFKMWVNVDYEGRTIEKSGSFDEKDLLYTDQWKVNNDFYWDGEKLMNIEKAQKDKYDKPTMEFLKNTKIQYLFFRTRTDYVNNLMQGSFERATEKTTATVVCEYPAKIVPDQKKYCGKMKELTINAMYDESRGRKRCLYTSLTSYSLDGTETAIKAFPGCGEKPSKEHSAHLDDGTASVGVYNQLTKSGAYRVAAIKRADKIDAACWGDCTELTHCDAKTYTEDQRKKFREPFFVFDHFMKKSYAGEMTSSWATGYPKDECSDFPAGSMDSKTLAIKTNQIIDVPVPVRFPAICSIETNVDCELQKQAGKSVCKSTEICENDVSWNSKTGVYAKCRCAEKHGVTPDDGVCDWQGGSSSCGMIHRIGTSNWMEAPIGDDFDFDHGPYSNEVDKAVVRKGCKMTVWSHPPDTPKWKNFVLLKDAGYGEHVVPNHLAGTLNGWVYHMSASGLDCSC